MESERFTCEECGKRKPMEQARMLKPGGAICEDCYMRDYITCGTCDYATRTNKTIEVCPDCVNKIHNLIHV